MKAMKRATLEVRDLLSGTSVCFGITAYNEGEGILPTLKTLWEAMCLLGLHEAPIILSDSSSNPATVRAAALWRDEVASNLVIDHSDRRRSLKEALNVILDGARSAVLVVTVSDVVIPSESLRMLLYHLLCEPDVQVAIGSVLPDPSVRGLRYRAGVWQLRAGWRLASWLPRSSVRAEGAFWAAKRSFYRNYRFPVGHGSIADDIELAHALTAGRTSMKNAFEAFVYKIPPGNLRDFCLTLLKWQASSPGHVRFGKEYLAAAWETVLDPVGALLYARARIWCRLNGAQFAKDATSETWTPVTTTKR